MYICLWIQKALVKLPYGTSVMMVKPLWSSLLCIWNSCLFNFLRVLDIFVSLQLVLWVPVWQFIFTMKPQGKFSLHLWLKVGWNRIQRDVSNDILTQTQFKYCYLTWDLKKCNRNYSFPQQTRCHNTKNNNDLIPAARKNDSAKQLSIMLRGCT